MDLHIKKLEFIYFSIFDSFMLVFSSFFALYASIDLATIELRNDNDHMVLIFTLTACVDSSELLFFNYIYLEFR